MSFYHAGDDSGINLDPDGESYNRGYRAGHKAAMHKAIKAFHEVEQILGKALGYPWYKDDKKNFPNATEADGVCVGDNIAESLAMEAATAINKYRNKYLECLVDRLLTFRDDHPDLWECVLRDNPKKIRALARFIDEL
jgi:hypothetical protein